jgi:hypothetical protein
MANGTKESSMTEDETPHSVSDILNEPSSPEDVLREMTGTSKPVQEGIRRVHPSATPIAGKMAPFQRELGQFFGMVGGAVMLVNLNDGRVIAEHADRMAAAWADLAKENPKVKSALTKLMAPGPWAGVVTATMPVVIAIAANHNMLPKQYAEIASEAERLGADEGRRI